MKDKTDQIIEAAIRVFLAKGFIQATTQEIAREAEVAEVTLFRKFSTKQNLFEAVITKALEEKFGAKILKLAEEVDTRTFFKNILNDRLTVISKNENLVKFLIAESVMGNLPDNLNFPRIIFESLKSAIKAHYSLMNQETDYEYFATLIGGILLGHAILPHSKPFYDLSEKSKDELLNRYVDSLINSIVNE